MWMKSEAPTSLETELDLIGHLVAASVSLCARRERIVQSAVRTPKPLKAVRERRAREGADMNDIYRTPLRP